MRGKKSDSAFVAQFIDESIQQGMETPAQIVQHVKEQIAQIDAEIKAVEAKKLVRSKLLDVILNFEKLTKDRSEDARLLPFFRLDYPRTCKFICERLKGHPLTIGEKNQLLGSGETDPQIKYSIKQMLECKIVARVNDTLVRSDRFDEYMKFVLREV